MQVTVEKKKKKVKKNFLFDENDRSIEKPFKIRFPLGQITETRKDYLFNFLEESWTEYEMKKSVADTEKPEIDGKQRHHEDVS